MFASSYNVVGLVLSFRDVQLLKPNDGQIQKKVKKVV